MQNQVHDAIRFQQENVAEITRVLQEVLNAAERFIQRPEAREILSEEVRLQTLDAISSKQLHLVGYAIRPHAARFGEKQCPVYWDMVDACNAFGDAVGSYWPYFTMGNREQSLKWAEQYAALVH